jgi:hypothetical protein
LLAPLLHSSKLTQAPRRLRFAPCASKKSKHNFYTNLFRPSTYNTKRRNRVLMPYYALLIDSKTVIIFSCLRLLLLFEQNGVREECR